MKIEQVLENVTRQRDQAESVLASVTDCLNTFIREHAAYPEVEAYLTLEVRDGLERLVFKLLANQ